MKLGGRIILLTLTVLTASLSRADTPPNPDSYVFAITSPSNLFYAVQTFTPIPFEGPQGAKMRFQVFSTATGQLCWETVRDGGYGTQSEVMLADDGQHVVCLPYWIHALGSVAWKLQKDKMPEEERKQLLARLEKSLNRFPVVTFYRRDKIMKEVFFAELNIPTESLSNVFSVSHVVLHGHRFPPFYTSAWNEAPIHAAQRRGLSGHLPDSRPEHEGSTITITFVDGKKRTFEITTGNIIKTEESQGCVLPNPFANDPFSESLPDSRIIKPLSDSSSRTNAVQGEPQK